MSYVEEMLKTWAAPSAEFRSAPFWSWNSRLEPGRLCRAIEQMHAAGMGGFFMHSRYGLKTPYLSEEWFDCVQACVDKARELGMKAYLYDEDRWPSGTAGGMVTREHPELGMHGLLCTPEPAPREGAERLGTFAVQLDEAGRLVSYQPLEEGAALPPSVPTPRVLSFDVVPYPPVGWWNDAPYLDTMNAEAVREFILLTHQAYADRFGKDFGGLIPAIFTDEPNYAEPRADAARGEYRLVWTAEMPRQFRKRRGYDVRDHLPELIFPAAEGEFSRVRHDFHRTASELFVEGFSAQIGAWCAKHKIAFTGHMLQEQTLRTQIESVGACMPHYEHFQWPGIDILTDQDHELITAKQTASVADQLGKGRVLSELYGCTGWDWPLEGHKFVGDWQYAAGVNFRCPHLTHFSLAGGAKRDYPASIFSHSPWWKHYGVVEDYFARLSFMLTQGKPLRDVLVIHPVESGWGCRCAAGRNELLTELDQGLDRITRTLSGQHYDWDFADESLLERRGGLASHAIKLGRMSYQLVLVPPSVTLRGTTVELLSQFLDAGGKVLFVGRRPGRIDAHAGKGAKEGQGEGETAPALAAVIARSATCDAVGRFIPTLEQLLPRRVSITCAAPTSAPAPATASATAGQAEAVWAMLRKVEGGQILFIQSHDRKAGLAVHVALGGADPVTLWDPRTGARTRVATAETGKGRYARVEFDLALPPTGSALLTVGLAVPDAGEPAAEPAVASAERIDGPFPIELTEPNTLPLDYCCYSFGDEPFSQPMPTLQADAEIRSRFGLGSRIGGGQQPWYLYALGTVDTSPRGRCRLRTAFHVTDLPPRCLLALERPEDFRITVNGKPAAANGGSGILPLSSSSPTDPSGKMPLPPPRGWWVDEDIRTIDVTALLTAGDNEIVLEMDYRADLELEDMYLVGDFGVRLRQGAAPAPGAMTLVATPRQLRLGSWVGQGLDFYGGAVRYRLTLRRPPGGAGLRIRLPTIDCTAAAILAGGKTFVLPWPPFEADLTGALAEGDNEVIVEVIGGRKNILGPLHVPWKPWTGPGEFDPSNKDWKFDYQLCHHGLMEAVAVERI